MASFPLDKLQLVTGGAVVIALSTYLYQTLAKDDDRPIYRGMGFPAFIRTVSPHLFEAHTDWGPWKLNQDDAPRHLLMTEEQCERVLRQNLRSHFVKAQGKQLVSWQVGSVASNHPNEDAWAVDVVSSHLLEKLARAENLWESWAEIKAVTETSTQGQSPLVLFSTIDGHGGAAVAQVVKRCLHPKIMSKLAKLEADNHLQADERVMEAISNRWAGLSPRLIASC
jgi:hypothetical protein